MENLTMSLFWLMVLAVVVGGVAAKVVSLALDGLVWLLLLVRDFMRAFDETRRSLSRSGKKGC